MPSCSKVGVERQCHYILFVYPYLDSDHLLNNWLYKLQKQSFHNVPTRSLVSITYGNTCTHNYGYRSLNINTYKYNYPDAWLYYLMGLFCGSTIILGILQYYYQQLSDVHTMQFLKWNYNSTITIFVYMSIDGHCLLPRFLLLLILPSVILNVI